MTHHRATNSFGRRAAQLALAAALVVVAGRIVHLACLPSQVLDGNASIRLAEDKRQQRMAGDERQRAPSSAVSNRQLGAPFGRPQPSSLRASGANLSGSNPPLAPPYEGGEMASASADAALARLYAVCPMANVVDLETVAHAPEEVDRLLPPYEPTADRQPAQPLEPAVPRIRYPIALRPGVATTPASELPPRSGESRGGADPPLNSPFPNPSHQGRGVSKLRSMPSEALRMASKPSPGSSLRERGDWLVDPDEWFIEGDRSETDEEKDTSAAGPESAEADSIPAQQDNMVDVSDADSAPTDETTTPEDDGLETEQIGPRVDRPSASQTPPTLETPSGGWGRAEGEPPVGTTKRSLPLDPNHPDEEPTDAIFSPPSTPEPQSSIPSPQSPAAAVDPHLALFAKNAYPSARECAECHEDIYHEWSVSAHAYAAVSPMFHKFEQKLNDLSQGTVGYFCMRCHAPVATALCASRAEPLWNLPEVAREGVTCIACHRVQYVYGKSNGERRIEPGNVFAPVMGGIGGHGVAEAIARKDHYKVKTSPEEKGPGQDIHVQGIYFDPLTRSEFCTPCHQVAVYPGIKLEVVWEQYRASPACKKGIQCQDCHMGRVPGLPLGYNLGPVAKMAGKTVNDHRRRSNHIFYGPNYSIAHPGIFPFHLKANRWTMEEWLLFDWRAGWGTEEFEDAVADGQVVCQFPPVWAEVDDRYDAREIIEENLKKLDHKREIRVEVMENGSHVEGPFFDGPLCRGEDLDFHYIVTNKNEGHNLLTASLGAQPQLWANVVLIGPDGRRLWETGYLDSYGDLANIHSEDVRHKRVPFDWQLFNLQTMFLITGAKGTDREFYLPVNLDIDQLAFIRPGVQPITTINHPPFIRMESQSLAPLGARRVPYRIPGKLIQQPGRYRLSFRMRSRAEPIYFMRFCEATLEMQRAMNEGMIDVHPMTVEFTIR